MLCGGCGQLKGRAKQSRLMRQCLPGHHEAKASVLQAWPEERFGSAAGLPRLVLACREPLQTCGYQLVGVVKLPDLEGESAGIH